MSHARSVSQVDSVESSHQRYRWESIGENSGGLTCFNMFQHGFADFTIVDQGNPRDQENAESSQP